MHIYKHTHTSVSLYTHTLLLQNDYEHMQMKDAAYSKGLGSRGGRCRGRIRLRLPTPSEFFTSGIERGHGSSGCRQTLNQWLLHRKLGNCPCRLPSQISEMMQDDFG